MTSDNSGFIDEIVQDDLPAHTVPPRDSFLPWHRVKKEYIRKHQWNDLTSRMIKRYWRQQLQMPEEKWTLDQEQLSEADFKIPSDIVLDRTLKCLVLPGEDLLDVRALCRDVSELNCRIRYLGFNESFGSEQKGTRIHVANNAVLSLPRVYHDSCVIPDRFESIQSKESQAYHYLKNYGPYHVVNLDLCGSMFPNTVKETQDFYNAVFRLLVYQFETQKTEWLLFVTTMVEPAVANRDGLFALCMPTRENAKRHSDFAAKLKAILPGNVFVEDKDAFDLKQFTEAQLIQLFGIAFGKWLLALCQKAQPQWTIAMRKSFKYSINDEKGAVMLSLAFALSPNITPPIDDSGMANLEMPARKYPSERECALKLTESVLHIKDVDSALAADQNLKADLRDSQADLLEAAGYDKSAFLKWVAAGEITTN